MSNDVPELNGVVIGTPRRVQIKLGHIDVVDLHPGAARHLASLLEGRHEVREAMAFLLRQGADAIETQREAMDDLHNAWLKTQPERP